MKTAEARHEIGTKGITEKRTKPKLLVNAGRVIMALKGTPAAFGTAEGPAFVLTNPHDGAALARVPEAAVLICRVATPEITAILPSLSAIVAEEGGMLSVCAGAARSYAIPAVIGVPGLTATIKDGNIVRVDGRRGVVKLIKDPPQKKL